ncbi:DNA primase [bacterium]|nr:DNA primase [bacterium]
MSFIDTKYINLISPQLVKFTKKKEDLYTFRCPYCGDSSKNQNKTRGYFYRKRSDFFFKCHNCGQGRTLANFFKDNCVSLYDEYVLERYKEGLTGKSTNTPNPKFNISKPIFVKSKPSEDVNILSNLEKISDLNSTHAAKAYLINRQIPEKYFSNFYYAEDFNAWACLENTQQESRIVIPLFTAEGKVFGHQGRSLDKNTKLRYITTILDKEHPKVFGLNNINPAEKIYVTEGPFDSLFLQNAIAMCGSDVALDQFKFNDVVYVLDNEPRNRQIVDRYEKLIDQGKSLVIWHQEIKEKDINDMVIAGRNVQHVVECNTYQGLEAKIKLTSWKKI